MGDQCEQVGDQCEQVGDQCEQVGNDVELEAIFLGEKTKMMFTGVGKGEGLTVVVFEDLMNRSSQ